VGRASSPVVSALQARLGLKFLEVWDGAQSKATGEDARFTFDCRGEPRTVSDEDERLVAAFGVSSVERNAAL